MNGSVNRTESSNILLYLPRGPYLPSSEDDESTIGVIRSHVSCPIVQINYRWDRKENFPTPVHDVLAGYDWALENLLPKRSISRLGRSSHVGRIAVCGEFMGGGLATALALTECRVGEPGIVAAAVNNPLLDWVSLNETTASSTRLTRKRDPQSSSIIEVQKLLLLRKEIFKRPVDYFDQFASPILFFRSAGADVPRGPVASFQNDMEHLSAVEREDFVRAHGAADRMNSLEGYSEDVDKSQKPPRKASKRFPSKSLGLKLPSFHITTGSMSPFDSQATELTTLLRQSIARQSKHAASNAREFGRKILLEGEEDEDFGDEQAATRALQQAEAEEKASFATTEGSSLWDSTPDGKERVLEVANWLGEHLR